MELTFVTNGPNVISNRLKRSQACENCRKRKKRCNHAAETSFTSHSARELSVGDLGQEPKRQVPIIDPTQAARVANVVQSHAANIASKECMSVDVPKLPNTCHSSGLRGQHTSPQNPPARSPVWRFVGDLNPEALFQRQSQSIDSPSGQDKVGVWQSQSERNELSAASDTPRTRSSVATSTRHIRTPSNRDNVDDISVIPPDWDRAFLIDIYFERINSAIPLIDEASFRADVASGSESIILIQAICVVAAKDHRARPYLKLSYGTDPLNVEDFCHSLAEALDSAFQSRTERDKLTLIRALALSSLHVDGPDGAEESSMRLMQAIHHAQTIGLHLDSARTELQDDSLGNLFWSLWSLDRLNACINGRPIMMSNIDIGIKVRSSSRIRNGDTFRVWLRIADMVDTVIEFYRPSTNELLTGWENDFPGFEEIVRDCGALQLPSQTLQTLELFYHSVAITSSRSQSFKNTPKSVPSTVRQALSAICIIRILKDQSAKHLLPLPVVPYSLSLALSVSYKQLRQTGLVTSRTQAQTQLKDCCKLLDSLSGTWWSAGAMAKLGRRALIEANRGPGATRNEKENGLNGLNIAQSSEALATQLMTTSNIGPVLASENGRAEDSLDLREEHNLAQRTGSLAVQGDGGSASHRNIVTSGASLQDDFSIPPGFDTSFDDIDQLLGDYLDLNLPTNFGDPLFIDDFYMLE